MTACNPEITSALIDGELSGQALAAARFHVRDCPDCQALIATSEAARAALRAPSAGAGAPLAVHRRVRDLIASEFEAAHGRGFSQRRFWQGAASGVAASLLAASIAAVMLVPSPDDHIARALADDHVQSLINGRTIEVVSSSRHTVRPWFAGRAPVAPPTPDLAANGFPLAGGRMSRIDGRSMAVVVYRHGPHEIDLYVWPSGGAMPAPEQDRLGFRMVSWREGDLVLAAISDTDPSELRRFAGLIRAARE